jgi:hypothetical protein
LALRLFFISYDRASSNIKAVPNILYPSASVRMKLKCVGTPLYSTVNWIPEGKQKSESDSPGKG